MSAREEPHSRIDDGLRARAALTGGPVPARPVYEDRQTLEAQCAKDADKLEMLLQAAEYRDIGVHRVEGWIETACKGLTTDTARRVADAAVSLSPLTWRDR